MQFRILLADNNSTERDLFERILRQDKHVVLTASSPNEARHIIENERLHLLIIDRRLTDDSEHDRSGEALVRELRVPFPVIIFTRWEVTNFIDVSKTSQKGKGKIEYLDKNADLRLILAQINTMLFEALEINHHLRLAQNIVNQVVTQLEHDGNDVLKRLGLLAGDLEDLLRHMFRKREQIELSILKQLSDPALVILDVQAQDMEPTILLVGHRNVIECIQQQIDNSNLRPEQYFLRTTAVWRFYGAIAISPTTRANKPQSLVSLLDWYKSNPDDFSQVWQGFEQSTLAAYYEQRRFQSLPTDAQLTALSSAFELSEQQIKQASLQTIAQTLAEQAIFDTAQIQLLNDQLSLYDRAGNCHLSWPVKLNLIEPTRHTSIKFGLVNKAIQAERILVDPTTKVAWLFDFSDIHDQRPLLQPFVQLEFDLKCQQFERQKSTLFERYQFELNLIQAESLRDELDGSELPPSLQTLHQNVIQIRQSAARLSLTFKPKEYSICMLFCLYKRLLTLASDQWQQRSASHLHEAYLSMYIGLLYSSLVETTPTQSAELCYDGSHFSINGQVIPFRRAEMELLAFLAQKPNAFWSTWTIVTSLYEPSLLQELEERRQQNRGNEREWQQNCLKSHQARLHTLISRIRRQLQDSSRESRYLITIPSQGLILKVRLIPLEKT